MTLVTTASFAQTQKERIEQAYIDNDKNYELSCYYFGPSKFRFIQAQGPTQRKYGELKRNFSVQSNGKEIGLEFKVTPS